MQTFTKNKPIVLPRRSGDACGLVASAWHAATISTPSLVGGCIRTPYRGLGAGGRWSSMAKKEVVNRIKVMAPGGKATPAPPLGPALGGAGVNPGQFVQQFNA